VIGTILNTASILAGGILGKTVGKDFSPATQQRLKVLLGALTVYVGLSLTWKSIHGSFGQISKQLGIVILSMMLGNFTGRLLHLQAGLNRLGQYARKQVSEAGPSSGNRFSEGFITCTLLFCVGPMAILGALQDGLNGDFKTLGLKSVMDGLATMAFAKTFGWGVMLSALPVFVYQGSITLAARIVQPILENKELLDALNATGGLLIFSIALVILEIRKVRLADYLPSLVFAPLLTYWWK